MTLTAIAKTTTSTCSLHDSCSNSYSANALSAATSTVTSCMSVLCIHRHTLVPAAEAIGAWEESGSVQEAGQEVLGLCMKAVQAVRDHTPYPYIHLQAGAVPCQSLSPCLSQTAVVLPSSAAAVSD